MPRKFVSNIHVTVKALGGSPISSVCTEIVDLAQRLLCGVECKFNDVLLIAGPDTDREGLVAAYHAENESKHPYKIATAWIESSSGSGGEPR